MARMKHLLRITFIGAVALLATLALLPSRSYTAASHDTPADNVADDRPPTAGTSVYPPTNPRGPIIADPSPSLTLIPGPPTSLAGEEKKVDHLYLEGTERALKVPAKVSVSLTGWTDIMTEDFEGTFPSGNWEVCDSDDTEHGEYYWARRDCRPHAGSHSAWAVGGGANGNALACGADYPNDAFSYMIYGPFDLSKATDARLVFHYWHNSESDDRFGWFASIDGNNFYGHWASSASGSWREETFDLTDAYFLGNVTRSPSVWIAFVFESDESDTRTEGTYVDDIVLSAYMLARPPTTLTVCLDGSCNYISIQDALDEAIYGDTIDVAPGTYKESITLVNGVRIRGSCAGESIIDGDDSGRVVKADGASISDKTILKGFTIIGGVAPTGFNCGGGVLVENGASPTIIGNEIMGNTALNGAGICVWSGAAPYIRDNAISGNTASQPGGGIYIFNSWPVITGNTITGNAGTTGGGIHARVESYPTIVNNIVLSNTASNSGGGIWIGGWGSYATGGALAGNTIRANTATYNGGGIQIETNASVYLSSNTIFSNTADWNGGGIHVTNDSSLISSEDIIAYNTADCGGGLAIGDNSLATMSKVVISDNNANEEGGGIYTPFWPYNSSLSLSNSLIERNTAEDEGGGIYIGQETSATVQTTAVTDNNGGNGGGIYLYHNAKASIVGNMIAGNEAYDSVWGGGGIYAYTNATFSISHNTILSNTAHKGGGIYTGGVISSTLTDNLIQGNEARYQYGGGGGVYVDRSEHLTVSGNTIVDNRAHGGGGIYFDNSPSTFKNNIIARNASSAIQTYGNITCNPPCSTAPIISNNTIVENGGSGISVFTYSANQDAPIITNNIIVSNTYGVYRGREGMLLYNNVWGNSEGDYHDVPPDPDSISADPLFVSGPRGEYYLSQVAVGQVVTSPCVDAGSDTAANLSLDDRTTRTDAVPDGGTVDMGYHHPIMGNLAALIVTSQADPDPVQAGEQLTYTIYITNTGDVDLHVTITDTLLIHAMPTDVLTWTPTITAPGGVWVQRVVVSVEMGHVGPLINVVRVTTEEGATDAYVETSHVTAAPTNQAPFTPFLPDPTHGAMDVPVTQTLIWQGCDPDEDLITYTVAFGTSALPPFAATTTLTRYTPVMSTSTTYHWVITASDGISASVGPTWNFTTISDGYLVYLPLVLRNH